LHTIIIDNSNPMVLKKLKQQILAYQIKQYMELNNIDSLKAMSGLLGLSTDRLSQIMKYLKS